LKEQPSAAGATSYKKTEPLWDRAADLQKFAAPANAHSLKDLYAL
jgi:hypothetical protein